MSWLLVAAALAAPAQRYAVVLGTNTGVGADAALRFADRDADRVGHVLTDLGDVPAENVLTLRNVDADRVRSALQGLSARIDRAAGDGETLLFVYYSGHADQVSLRLQGQHLPFSELVATLEAMPVDVRVLVVDACQSGELTRLKGASPAEPFTIVTDDSLDAEGLAVLTSSSPGEDAQESDRLEGGIFTHHFVAGLMGAADLSADGRVTLSEAHSYARDATIRATSAARFVQHPSFATELRGGSDLVLTRVDDPGSASALELADPGLWMVFDERSGSLLAEADVADASRLVLPQGDYLVRVRQDAGIREDHVTLRSGESMELFASAMTAVSPGRTVRKGIDEDRRAATAVVLGAGLMGATTPLLPIGFAFQGGVAVDLEALTLGGRLATAFHRDNNPQLLLRQQRAGLEVSALRKSDARALALGLGLRGGLDLTRQAFETSGTAPDRQAVSVRFGPVLALDARLGTRQLVSLLVATDIQLYRLYQPITQNDALASRIVPTFGLEFARYVR